MSDEDIEFLVGFDDDGLAQPTGPAPSPQPRARRRSARIVPLDLRAIEPEAVRWLWPGWLARGKLHILGGHPGDGKSTLAIAVAANLSTGGSWPDGGRAPLGRALIMPAEDGIADTVIPRLREHHADTARVAVATTMDDAGRERLIDLTRDISALEEVLVANQYDLLVIDPLTGYMPGSDRNAEGAVRDILTPLAAMADRTGTALLAIMHVGKPSGISRRPLQQLLGATAFGAVARLVWMTAPAPGETDGPERRALGVVKSNLAERPRALEWSRDRDAAIQWHGDASASIEALLRESGVEPKRLPRDDAREFLLDLLGDGGPLLATDIQEAARVEGIAWRTVRRAADGLPIAKRKVTNAGQAHYFWELTPTSVASLSTSIPEEVDNLDNLVTREVSVASLSTSIPEGVDNLDNLVTREVSVASLSTSIPEGVDNLDNLVTREVSVASLSTSIPEGVDKLSNAGGSPTLERSFAAAQDDSGTGGLPIRWAGGNAALGIVISPASEDPWRVETTPPPPTPLKIRDILKIEDREKRRRLLRLHPVSTRQAAIDWCQQHATRMSPEVHFDLLALEVDDTTPQRQGSPPHAIPDQAFCSVCSNLLPLPADRARGHHLGCVA